MALVEMNWHPDHRQCRQFGWGGLVILPLIALLIGWMGRVPLGWAIGLGAAGVVIFTLSRISDSLVRPVYVGLTLLGLPIGWVMSYVILAVFYFGILTPLAVVFKIIGRDALCRKPDKTVTTYWTPHRSPASMRQYFNQF